MPPQTAVGGYRKEMGAGTIKADRFQVAAILLPVSVAEPSQTTPE